MTRLPVNRRGFLGGSAALISALTLRPSASWSVEGGILRIREEGDIANLDPMKMAGLTEEVVMRGIYTTLVTLGDVRDGSKLSNWAASSMEQVDPTTIKFVLKPGLKWSGGFGPVTPDDVKFSYERIADPANESPWKYQFEKLDKVEVIDDLTGLIKLKEPFAPLWWMSLPWYGGHIISRKATEKVGGSFTTEPPAVCGPYVMAEWQPKQKIVLQANPDWPGPAAAFPTVEIIIVEDNDAALLAYEADSFDYTKVNMSATERLKKSPLPDTKLIEAQSSRYVWLTVNMEHPKLQDPRVRQALQYAFDGASVITGAYNDLVPRSAGLAQPGTFGARDKNIIDTPDYEKAKALLAEAGASDLELELAVMNTSTPMAIAQIIQATMAQAGITISIMPYDEGVYWTLGDQASGETYKTLQLVLMQFSGGIDPSENMVWFRPDQVGVYNWSRWKSDAFEKLYQEGLVEQDQAKRAEIYKKMQDLMEESGAFIFITHEPLVAVYRDFFEPVVLADTFLSLPQCKKA
ncbi:peptide/nickel transport system substrate-binding protein [Rhodoligotrophos appendicifer]|uniref:ABC transporter substrate-binding protein n=1 Tax=Rhodoligotrophos appendicifer TaxID=987056 RepID=UPI001185E54D|nr:ABC transporter substrate-binding protein [Rhodoligotrophos appendicifer]